MLGVLVRLAGKIALQAIADEWLPVIGLGGGGEASPVVDAVTEPSTPLPGLVVAERVAEEVKELLRVPCPWR